MSNFHIAGIAYRFSGNSLAGRSASRVGACAFILMAALFTTACGLIGQSDGNPAQTLALSANLPVAVANEPYNAVLTVGGGSAPYQFAVKSGSLPPGTTLNPVTGSVAGTPTAAGSYAFRVAVTDAPHPGQGSQSFTISVASKNGGGIRVSVSPTNANLTSNQKQTFTAKVVGTRHTGVSWSASAGSITDSGEYTAPPVSAATNVTVTAASNADPTRQGSAAVVVEPAGGGQSLAITTTTLPNGQMGTAYDTLFTATGGTQPYSWSASGNVPSGITLNASSGDFAGMPGAAGTFSFTVAVADASGQTAQQGFTLVVAAGGNFDGPAELPRVTVASSQAATPAPGSVIVVNAGGNLQTALNNANCGDTIELQAGATYTGVFKFPAKNCDDNHWVIVRTSAPDSALPLEGQRLTPCYAGVASLPNRPTYDCAHPQNVLAQLSYSVNNGAAPIVFLNGANHYRLIGLEITRPQNTVPVVALVSVVNGMAADHLIFDRVWVHGTAQDETRRGFALSGTNNVAIVDSYLNDFHCTSLTGTCTDSQAVGGGTGDIASGPWKIENNFLEAAGEVILFGGGPATIIPADITIRRNHFYKVPQWQKGSPGYVGGYSGDPFIVKNLFELKNGARVLLEANILEHNWGGFTQHGHAILLTPKNQYSLSTDSDVCPLCQVTDVTIRYNTISHVGGGFTLATVRAKGGGEALAGARYSVHDVTVDDVDALAYNGYGNMFQILNGWSENVLNSVTINHVTAFTDPASRVIALLDLTTNPQMWGFVATNNILGLGSQTFASAGGGPTNCAHSGIPLPSLDLCFSTYTFGHNAIIGSSLGSQPSAWPAGNYFPATPAAVQFTNFNNANGGNYQLLPSSPYSKAGSDGKDLGADIGALQSAISGVY
jgi:putative Ig domain-containing protein